MRPKAKDTIREVVLAKGVELRERTRFSPGRVGRGDSTFFALIWDDRLGDAVHQWPYGGHACCSMLLLR